VTALAGIGTNSQVLWYLARGTGLVDLVLLTLTLVLGIGQLTAWSPAGWPRFVVGSLHRNAALLSVCFLALHVVTILLDTYVQIGVWAVFVPLVSGYHPLTLGLGAISLDLLVAVVVTSLLREKIGYRTWRTVHWAAYGCWPLAVAHGLALGTDRSAAWVLALNAVCIAAVVGVGGWRLSRIGRSEPPPPGPLRPPPSRATSRFSPQSRG
jgi:methionine sulfoxide reductase heme-binding subunit